MTPKDEAGHTPGVAIALTYALARRDFRAHARLLIAAQGILLGLWAALEAVVFLGRGLGPAFNLVVHLGFLVGFSGVAAGFLGLTLDIADGRAPGYAQLFSRMRRGPDLLAGSLLFLLGTLVGGVLLLVPGVLFGSRRGLFGYIVTEKPVRGWEGLRRSAELADGAPASGVRLFLSALLLNLAGAAFLGIGLFVSIPISTLAGARAYRALSHPYG